jgi:uncharacterized protein (DUF1778 family)
MSKTRKTKAKMGRPPKPPAEKFSARVCAKMTQADRRRLERAAKAAGQELAEFVRRAALDAADRQEGAKQ